MNYYKFYVRLLSNNKNVKYNDFVNLLLRFGFYKDRTEGSHTIFKHDFVKELINIQNVKGEVKPYQINQFLSIVEKYSLEYRK